MPRRIRVSAGSRLHFGLLSFGHAGERQFGGAGVMVQRPRLVIEIEEHSRVVCEGELAARAEGFARRFIDFQAAHGARGCRIRVREAPPQHAGLGLGTQLALSIAAGMRELFSMPRVEASELAHVTGRAARSSVGTYGFDQGGLIVEAGRREDERVAPLISRLALPAAWRFVLATQRGRRQDAEGMSGDDEQRAFATLPPMPRELTDGLCREIVLHLLPAARAGDYASFADSVYRYGRAAGEAFATCQCGPFASRRVAALVDRMRELGGRGVGQSSWGPTVFAVLPDQHAAEAFARRLRDDGGEPLDVIVTPPENQPARIEVLSP